MRTLAAAVRATPVSRPEANDTRNPLRVRLKPDPQRAFLEERDISQDDLTRLVGISSGYLSRLCPLRGPA